MTIHRFTSVFLFILLSVTVMAQPVTVQKSEVKVTEAGRLFFIHTVSAGQTLYSIAKAYGTDQEEILRFNPSISGVLRAGQILKIPDISATSDESITTGKDEAATATHTLIHIVSPGETLYAIARKYQVSAQEVMDANPSVTDFEKLTVGQELKILLKKPGPSVITQVDEKDSIINHIVQKGESLFGISQQYKVPIDSIVAWNPDLSDKPLRKGQELKIILKQKTPRVIAKPEPIMYDTILHQIRDKETIWGIARRYNTTVEQIMVMNPELNEGLKKGYYIYILVPTKGEKTASSQKTIGCENSRYRSKYKIALFIPLYLDEIDRIYISPPTDDQIKKAFFKPFSFIEFYEGILIAVDSIKKKGLSIDLYVFDTNNDSNTVKRILTKPEMPFMDLIIGPFFADNYNLVVRYAVNHNIKVISPFARNPQFVAQHSNIFQMNASSDSKIGELAHFIARSYQEPNVIMVTGTQGADKALAKIFRDNLESNASILTRKPRYVEVVYQEKGLTGVTTHLDVNKPNIIVNLITGETMIANYISNIAKLTKNFDITMFGLPEWQDYRTFDLTDLMAVDLHLFANTFVDYNNPATMQFLKEFRARYKSDPEEGHYGYLGYDIGLYFCKALFEFGLDFENCFDQISYDPVSTNFKWEQVNGKGYENVYLNIFRYNDFKLKPVKQP